MRTVVIKLIFGLFFTWLSPFHQTAIAEDLPKKRLAIIDTGIDSNFPNFDGYIVHEVCIIFWGSCPNGLDYQEGKGSATLSDTLLTYPTWNHGTQMARVAVITNPEIEMIFLRVVGNNSKGGRLPISLSTVERSLDWVLENSAKHNIGAVAMSQGHHNLHSVNPYCPSTPQVEDKIVALKQLNIPVFLPTGNAGDKSRIDWPACIRESIAVGAINSNDQITNYTNMDRYLTDFYALGEIKDSHPDGVTRNYSGTSVSVQVAAAGWIDFANKSPGMSMMEIYSEIRQRSPIVWDKDFRYGRKFDTEKFNETESEVAAEAKTGMSVDVVEEKTVITCTKGKRTKKVKAFEPKCPKGYKKK